MDLRIFLFRRYKSRRRPHPRSPLVTPRHPFLTHLTQLDRNGTATASLLGRPRWPVDDSRFWRRSMGQEGRYSIYNPHGSGSGSPPGSSFPIPHLVPMLRIFLVICFGFRLLFLSISILIRFFHFPLPPIPTRPLPPSLPFHYLSPLCVGRRRTAAEYNWTAEKNGWIPGAYKEEDRVQ